MNMISLKKRLTPKVIAGVVVIILVIAYIGYVRSDNRVTWAMYRTPLAEIQLLNDEGRTIKLGVRFMDNPKAGDNPYKGVGVNTIQKNNLYYAYARDVNISHNTRDIKAPIDMAFFCNEGSLLNIFQAKANSSTLYRPITAEGERINYRYVIMTGEGFWAKNSISEGTEAKFLPDTFKRKK